MAKSLGNITSLSLRLLALALSAALLMAANTTTATEDSAYSPKAPGLLFDQLILRPSLGMVFLNDDTHTSTGLLVEAPAFHASTVTLSIASGFLYSNAGSNPASGSAGAIYQVPLNLKILVHAPTLPELGVGPHVGGNWVYSSLDDPTLSTSGWNAHVNFGADVDYTLSNRIGLEARYDATLMSALNMQTLTFDVGITI